MPLPGDDVKPAAKDSAEAPGAQHSAAPRKREVVQSGLKFEIGRPAAHPGVAESAGRPAGSSG